MQNVRLLYLSFDHLLSSNQLKMVFFVILNYVLKNITAIKRCKMYGYCILVLTIFLFWVIFALTPRGVGGGRIWTSTPGVNHTGFTQLSTRFRLLYFLNPTSAPYLTISVGVCVLKVHKREIFYSSDFEFFTIS